MDRLRLKISLKEEILGDEQYEEFKHSLELKKSHRNLRLHSDYKFSNKDFKALLGDAFKVAQLARPVFTSLEPSLTSLELYRINIFPPLIIVMSRCKNIESLTICKCKTPMEDAKLIRSAEFNKLRNIRLFESPAIILEYFKCLELDWFLWHDSLKYIGPLDPVIRFLNKLVRCDGLDIDEYNFTEELMPKFKWKMLRLRCGFHMSRVNDNTIVSFAALSKASAVNAEAHVTLMSFGVDDDTDDCVPLESDHH